MDFSNIKIDKVVSVFELLRIKEDYRKITNRYNSGLVLIKNGKISYYHDGNEYVQTSDVVMLLPKGSTYSLYCHEEASCCIINFDAGTELSKNEIYAIKLAQKNNVFEKLDKMSRTWGMSIESHNLLMMSLMYGILADLNASFSMDNQQRKYYEIIKPSIDFMEKHYYDYDIKNEDLARISNISTVYFRKIFTKLYGVGPIHYLEIRKIEKAKELLSSEELSITEIATASGFKDIYHLCRAFKKITGVSPGNYRKKFFS